ncbi:MULTISPECIES: glycosyltransferase family 2 protein [unclassified Methylophilus]|uniref:glycosyltransferase family 2 protein n=1 Tax=unclassified Methylophilus TaxID=2630143 RepID=UPI0023B3085B|nr:MULTISPECIES: glycosyltransferase family 2 protein [unclassified Methylophilus]MDF0376687.1 rhamnosyltransferase [Methylophilus sp. YYY-1]MDT7850585.1 glycosyltransferase family 2 protein [Methylophilus sp. VKM B-3414]BEV07910.1 glycosyltransferase family 2 protein [Methylophilus sp. DW102]
MNNKKVLAAVVTYNPCNDSLSKLVSETKEQVDEMVIIDNSPLHSFNLNPSKEMNVKIIHLADNMGIAYAQNIAIEYAIKQKFDYILFLDQDSVPTPHMVNALLKCFCELAAGNKVAITAPVTIDARTKIESPFLVLKHGYPVREVKKDTNEASHVTEACFLISSGSLVSLEAIQAIGGNRSGYFIDHVDTEWCMRALCAGYKLYGVNDARLIHAIGDHAQTIPFMKNRQVSHHAPYRDYYMFRNTVFCIKNISGLYPIKLFLLLRLLYFCLFFIIFAPNRLLRIRMLLLGLFHGLTGIDGKLITESSSCIAIPKSNIEPN